MEKVGFHENSDEDLRVKHKSGGCNTRYFWIIIVLLGIHVYLKFVQLMFVTNGCTHNLYSVATI